MNLITSNQLTMSSNNLYDLVCRARSELGESTPRLNDFHARLIDELEGEHYESFVVQNPNKTSTTFYSLTMDQCALVGMRESKAVRRYIRDKLKELEAKLQPPAPQLPQNYLEALEQLVEKEKLLIAQAPKVAFVDNLVERKNLLNATQVAQPHKMSAMKLNKMLDEYGGVYSKAVKRGRVFCQPWIDGGFGEMKVTETGFNQCLFTTLGEQKINEILVSEGAV